MNGIGPIVESQTIRSGRAAFKGRAKKGRICVNIVPATFCTAPNQKQLRRPAQEMLPALRPLVSGCCRWQARCFGRGSASLRRGQFSLAHEMIGAGKHHRDRGRFGHRADIVVGRMSQMVRLARHQVVRRDKVL